jgi:chemotaxis response regulator CheB
LGEFAVTPTGLIRILIIDSSPTFRMRAARIFGEREGVESIVTASDTRTARERIRSHKPDVILLSLDLHHQDAMPFLSRLREYYPVPVLVMGASGLRAGRQAQSAIANGALDAFVRPDDLSPPVSKLSPFEWSKRLAWPRARPDLDPRRQPKEKLPSLSGRR